MFVPGGSKGADLVAHVADGSPAQKVGIRSGDLLLKIDELDVTKWRTDPAVLPLNRFWSRPAGTKRRLTLQRDGQQFDVTVELQDILFPDGEKSPSSSKASSLPAGPSTRP